MSFLKEFLIIAIPIINVSILNGSNGFRLDGAEYSDQSGVSVSSAGDINGDGFDDVMVGAVSNYSPYTSNSGSSYVVFGKASGFSAAMDLSSLDSNNGFHFVGGGYPFLVSSAGDINGDGFDDVIIGAPGESIYPYGHNDGASYVVFGRASGFTADISLSSLDGSNGFRLGVAGSDQFSISDAGDVNGDGFDDVIVGAADTDSNDKHSASSSYVVFGRASGFDAVLDLSNLDGNNGFHLYGGSSDSYPFLVSSAGDINGDGFDDVIIGAPGAYDYPQIHEGGSYVVFGRASGFAADINLSSLDGSNGFSLYGTGSRFVSVSSAGDINGDGFADVIVGAPYADPNGSVSGSSYVVFGKASGFDATLDLSSLDGNNGFRLDGAATYDYSGRSVSNAGDVNGDGFDDLLVGASGADSSGTYDYDAGSSYVVFGRASDFAATLDLSSLDGNDGFRLEGVAEDDRLGGSVSSAGDVNSDGFDDLIIGAPGADPSGSSYVIFGGDFITGEAVYLGAAGDDNFVGTTLAERFEAGEGNDRMNGRGGTDIFHGDGGDDTIAVADLDFQQVDGGTGSDTLELTESGLNLDLANFHDTIDGIETIDLTGSGDNTLMLTLLDLLSLSDTTDTFTVDGNGGDRVSGLMDGWTDTGIVGDYRIFTNSGTTLRVDRTVSTDMPIGGVINLADLDGNNGFRLDGGIFFRGPVSSAGDVNNDGFDDVIVGDLNADPNGRNSGSSYVVFGKAAGFDAAMELAGLDGSNGFRLDGVAEEDYSGSVSNAGDVNGDGFDDVIVGAYRADPNGDASGSSYVVFGKASGFSAAMDLSSLDGTNGFSLDGVAAYDVAGKSVSSAGDINGDGFADLLVGAPYADPNGDLSGSSYVVFGKAAGFDAALDLSSLDGSNGFRLDGVEVYDGAGGSVSNAGDVNGDGFDDVIIGARADPNGNNSGSSYVVFGKAAGFDAAMNLAGLDGSNGFRLDGVAERDYAGGASSAGDVNGDGFDDLIIGAPGADPNGDYSGSSYVVFGRASGFSASMDLSSLDGTNGFRLDGVAAYDVAGVSVSNAGDVNGDGFDDLLVGAFGADPNGSTAPNSGASYVVFGKASGFGAVLDLSSLDGTNGVRLDGVAAYDESGGSVSSAGDVNGDGFDDLIIGTNNISSSYVLFGRSDFGGSSEVIPGTPGDDILTGTSAADRFEAGDGNDRMIGRGGADEFLGEAGDDYIRVSDLDFESVDGGIGNDTLALGDSGLNLNLTDMAGKISGIETIRLFGTGDNTLTLRAADVLNLSDTTNTLRVNGNAGDRIIGLSHGWGGWRCS